ncbi:MAG: transporter ATP-binding protein [Caulobacter sp.]|nr:transporter ATP-binding protein [Caulobacter sp.]
MSGVAQLTRLIAEQRRAQGRRLLIAAAAAALVSAAAVLLLGLSGWFITGAALAGAAGPAAAQAFNYLLPSAGIRFLAIVRTGARYVERLSGHEAALKALAKLRPALFAGLAAAPPSRALAWSSGEASARMVQDVDAIQTLFVRLSAPWGAIAAIAAGLILAGLAGWPAAAVVLAAVIVAVGAAAGLGRTLSDPAGRAVQTGAGELKASFSALQAAAPELRAYGLEGWAVDQVAAKADALGRQTVRAAVAGGWIGVSQSLVIGAVVAGVLIVVAHASPPLAALAALAAITAVEGAAALVAAFRQAGGARQAMTRIGAVFDAPPARALQRPADAALRLPSLDLDLAPPARLAVTGLSGAGKTTLVERLMGLRDPVAGEARLGGVDLADIDVEGARTLFAYAAQDVRLLAGTVADNLRLAAPDASDDALWTALEDADLADRVRAAPAGLDAALGDNGERLSGGERRRLGLARAYLRDAPWLVLDEPTEGLDAATEATVLERLARRLTRSGQGLILISHRPAPCALCAVTLRVRGVGSDGRLHLERAPARAAA